MHGSMPTIPVQRTFYHKSGRSQTFSVHMYFVPRLVHIDGFLIGTKKIQEKRWVHVYEMFW